MKRTLLIMIMVLSACALAFAATDSVTLSDVGLDTPEVAELAIAGTAPSIMLLTPNAGQIPGDAFQQVNRLEYTSTVESGKTRKIQARQADGNAPAGCQLKLVIVGTPGTNQGSYASEIIVSGANQDIITGIGSCATGIGEASPAEVKFTLHVDSVTSLVAGEHTIPDIVFDLTDDAV